MVFEIKLKEVIIREYGSVRAFAKAIDTPYSTINNIFKRGIMGVSIQIVLKICSALNIDVEKIQEDKLEQKISQNINKTYASDGDIEDTTISLYNNLDSNDKAEIRGEIKQMLKADKYNTEFGNENMENIDKIIKGVSSSFEKNKV